MSAVLNNQQSSLPWIILGGSIGLMGGIVLYSSYVQHDEDERVAPRPEPVWGLTRRFTNGQVCLLEKWYKGGVTRPTRGELDELSHVIGKTGAHGLLLSRNMIRLWFQERLERGEHMHTCADDGFKDCECWLSETSRPPPSFNNSGPLRVTLKPGKEVWVCMCGQSGTYPLCDGSHKTFNEENELKIKPVAVKNDGDDEIDYYICTCGHSNRKPLCDGTHKHVISTCKL